MKTHKQDAGLPPQPRPRDKANSKLLTACLPSSTSYSSQMANPTTEAAVPNCLKPTEMGKNKNRDKTQSSWREVLLAGSSSRALLLSACWSCWPGHPVHACSDHTCLKVCSWMLSSFQNFLNQHPFYSTCEHQAQDV